MSATSTPVSIHLCERIGTSLRVAHVLMVREIACVPRIGDAIRLHDGSYATQYRVRDVVHVMAYQGIGATTQVLVEEDS